MSRIRDFIRRRLVERSTIAGLITLACTIGGFTLDVEQQASLVTLLSAIAGVFLVFTREDVIRQAGPSDPQPESVHAETTPQQRRDADAPKNPTDRHARPRGVR